MRVGKTPGGRGCPAGILGMSRSIPGRWRWRNFQLEGRVTCGAGRQETKTVHEKHCENPEAGRKK